VRDTRGLDGYISRPVDPGELLVHCSANFGLTYLTGDEPPPEYHTEAARKLLTREAITVLPPA
jgi:hypothetical protein